MDDPNAGAEQPRENLIGRSLVEQRGGEPPQA